MRFLFDFFPVLLFFIAYKMYDIFVATAVAIAASFIQVSGFWLKYRRFETMHLVTLGLIAILGGLTLILHDPRFLMWKVTAVNYAFGIAFIGSQFIGRKPLVQPDFFREGMEQMDSIGYPDSVREVMESYYKDWSNRTLH